MHRRLAAVATILVLAACGGGGGGTTPPPAGTGEVTIFPTAANLNHGAGKTFAIQVDGADQRVTWSVEEGSPAGGTVSAAGAYTAPFANGTFHVVATSVANPAKKATAILHVTDVTGSITGAISAAAGQVADGDVADPNQASVPNDDPATAQAISSAVTVGGHVGGTDQVDAFRVRLAAGQRITLAVADATAADLDLFLFDQADPGTPVDSSEGPIGTAVEAITVATGGDYYVVVATVSLGTGAVGASNYLLTVGAAPAGAAAPAPNLSIAREFVPGEVLVRFRSGAVGLASTADLAERAAGLGLRMLGGAPGSEVLLALGDGGPEGRSQALRALGAPGAGLGAWGRLPDEPTAAKRDTLAAIKALRRRADVEAADPNYVFHPAATPTDQHYGLQWHYPLINLPQAWDVTTGTPTSGTVVVAVVDTGVFLAHPDLSGKLVAGYDFISDASRARDGNGIDANPDDPGDAAVAGQSSFHGTHVAGTIGAQANGSASGGSGVAGVSWGARVMPIRALGLGGGTSFDIMNGLKYAAGLPNASGTVPARRADVINLSIGCLGCSSVIEQTTYTQVRNAGVIVVAAAGNENSTTASYPASYDGVISVSSVDMQAVKAPYSNSGIFVDVAAPGGDSSNDRNGDGYVDGVLSTIADDSSGVRRAAYSFLQGTSMASPHMAGVAALMKANCPTLTPDSLDALLLAGTITRDIGAAGRDNLYGHGLIDAYKAVTACAGAPPPASLGLAPGRIDAGTQAGPFTVVASQVGTGTLAAVTATSGAAWLTATSPGASGLGSWTVAIDRTGLADGTYASSLSFRAGTGTPVQVPVTMTVGAASATGEVGHVYVLLVDPAGVVKGQDEVSTSPGVYAFAGVPGGPYKVVAGTDHDNDNFICDGGEACGAWPTMGGVSDLEVTGAMTGVDFGVGFDVGVGGLAAGAAAGEPGRAPILRATSQKALGGGR